MITLSSRRDATNAVRRFVPFGLTSIAARRRFWLAVCGASGLVMGCAPPLPPAASPHASVLQTSVDSTTAAAPRVVKKPEFAPTRLLDPWEELAERKTQLNEDIDRWLAVARQATSPPQSQRLFVLRRLHGTGGFLRQAQRELREHPGEYPTVLSTSLDELSARWEQFEQRLADMNRAHSLTQPTPP